MYEVAVTQGVVKLYELEGGKKNEKPIDPDGPTQTFVRLIGKSDKRPTLKFPLSVGQNGRMSTKLDPPAQSLINGGLSRSMLLGWNR